MYGVSDKSTAPTERGSPLAMRADDVWQRYQHCTTRGHREYTLIAQQCERMFLGGGRQWYPEEAATLRQQGREPYEFNEILPSVNAAIGHQIKNRMDIAFRPRGGNADQIQADIRAKIVMHIADRCHLRWKETEVFTDGLVQQRGYFDVRMDFRANMNGDVAIRVPDPMDVIPDPDAKTYEPEGWADVLTTRWLTKDEIEQDWGRQAAEQVFAGKPQDDDFGQYDDSGAQRPKFADPAMHGHYHDAFYSQGGIVRARIVEQQRWVNQMSRVLFYPRTGDRKLAENLLPEVIEQQLAAGAVMTRAMQRRVRWAVASCDAMLHDEWSPYDSFTIIPFFAYFRRGQTIGMVDNAMGPQRALNKALAQYIHIVNTTANSGWVYEENSLVNMTDEEFEAKGAMTGLMLKVKKGTQTAPTKIPPNQVPAGVEKIIDMARNALKSVTVPDAMRGQDGPQTSGKARQTQQFAAQQQIAGPLDNLARTRHLLGEKLASLTQQFYTEQRTFRITETDFRTGRPVEQAITINEYDPQTGGFVNDMTEGEYDVVVSEQPAAVTFEESQFNQAMDMREAGVAIPDTVVVQSSNLSRKPDILEQMAAAGSDPLTDAKVALIASQTKKAAADAVNSSITAIYSAVQAANQIAALPAIANSADQLLKSGGFQDADAPPIVEQPAGMPQLPAPDGAVPGVTPNTSPGFPPKPAAPDVGVMNGIERPDPGVGVPA